jgi:hypothetical protein
MQSLFFCFTVHIHTRAGGLVNSITAIQGIVTDGLSCDDGDVLDARPGYRLCRSVFFLVVTGELPEIHRAARSRKMRLRHGLLGLH